MNEVANTKSNEPEQEANVADSSFRVHVVPQFHYDVEYILTLGEYQEISFNNLLEAHRILSENKEYTFMVEQTYLLESFLAEHPSKAVDFAKWANEGRFEVASGMYAMADVNIPSGESLVRQLLYGKKWCAKNLNGYIPSCLNNGDCPGGHTQMPQIARMCGYEYFIFERGVDDSERVSEFIWRGLDGSEIKTCWLPLGYGGWRPPHGSANDAELLSEAIEVVKKHSSSNELLLATGGDFRFPDEGGIAAVKKFNSSQNGIEAAYSTYAAGMKAMDWDGATIYEGEFNPDRQGYFSGRIRLKQMNRLLERLIFTTEALSVSTRDSLGIPYDHERLDRAWKLVFLNQFHDSIWGTVTDHSYKDAIVRHTCARMICDEIVNRRVSAILAAIPTKKENDALVYNSLPWERECWVDSTACETGDFSSILRRSESPASSQGNGAWLRLPPSGYILHDFAEIADHKSETGGLSVKRCSDGGLRIETPFLSAEITERGAISELRGKDGTLFTNPEKCFFNTICYQSDNGDLMYCYESPLLDTLGKGLEADTVHDPCPENGVPSKSGRKRIGKSLFSHMSNLSKVSIEESFSDRIVIRVEGRIGNLGYNPKYMDSGGLQIEFIQRVVFHSNTPRIDCSVETKHIKGRHYRLRAMFPAGLAADSKIYHEIPFGEVVRPEGEFIAQNYMRCEDDEKGLGIINKGMPGNNVTENVMMLSLMRSAYQEYLDPCDMASEEGETHLFEYAILPYKTNARPDFARIALELNTSPIVCRRSEAPPKNSSDTTLSASFAGLSISASEIVCSAIYAEGDATVIRAYNSTSKSVTCEITIPENAAEVAEANALLDESARIAVTEGIAEIAFKPFEVKTLKCM